MLNYDGSMISSILPPTPVKADLRAAQIQAANDSQKKFMIAKAFVQAKIARSLQVLDWLGQRYDLQREIHVTRLETSKLGKATTVADLRVTEGRVARRYWKAFGKILPEHLDFHGRMTTSDQNNAADPVNLSLNYAYGVLEGECRKAINAVGLEPSIGFLHDFSQYQTKQSFVYDLQEPFRWLADISVIEAFESEALKLSDFYFTGDDYRYRFENEAKQRFIHLIRERFNSGTRHKGRILKWDTIIEEECVQLARFLVGKVSVLQLAEPQLRLGRSDSSYIRKQILGLTQQDAQAIGISKSTLHYLRRNTGRGSFVIYRKVREKVEQIRLQTRD